MLYGVLADIVMVAHFSYVAFVIIGGFLAWRWRWLLWLHLPAVIWGLLIIVGFGCPLTPLEKHLRRRAGQAGYSGGFVEHYLTGVLYPARLLWAARTVVIAAVVLSYAWLLVKARRGWHSGQRR